MNDCPDVAGGQLAGDGRVGDGEGTLGSCGEIVHFWIAGVGLQKAVA